MRLACITLVTTILLQSDLVAQFVPRPKVEVTARATDRSIKLRWAPNSPVLWQLANQHGYVIERFAITKNNKLIEPRKREALTPSPMLPAAPSSWEAVMDDDDYAAIAAQAIFGESFEVTPGESNDRMRIINKAKETESRFSFALFAADQSRQAAALSALYFEDETIDPDTRYLYRVYANVPASTYAADTGFVYIGLKDFQPLPKPMDLQAEFQDKHVILSWNGALFNRIYNAYRIEKSTDGKTFLPVSKEPFVNAFTGEQPKTDRMFKVDSLDDNEVEHHYRIIGLNAFGEAGPPSDTVGGRGRAAFVFRPSITTHAVDSLGRVELYFSFPEDGLTLLRTFELGRLDLSSKKKSVLRTDLEKRWRSVRDDQPRYSNYYVVDAIDIYGRRTSSFPYLVQLEDSIPPSAPEGLTGTIDTLGVVRLAWNRNPEEDVLGYSVYRANFLSDEFVQVSGRIRNDEHFHDTLKLTTLTETVHYRIVAMDKRFNPSPFSRPLTLKKPDFIAPSPPVLSAIYADTTGIHLGWQMSNSHDVVQHLLYRRTEQEHEWTLLQMIEPGDTVASYTDREVAHQVRYHYTLVAVDDAGLESAPAPPLSMVWRSPRPLPPIGEVFHLISANGEAVTLRWVYPAAVNRFTIYKSVNGSALALYQTIPGDNSEWRDRLRETDKTIEYRIIAQSQENDESPLSDPVIINR